MGMKPRKKPQPREGFGAFLFECSFCKASRDVAEALITGPRVSICAECVSMARNHIGQIRFSRALKQQKDST